MRKTRLWFAVLAACALCLSVAACGSTSGGTTTVVTVVKQAPASESTGSGTRGSAADDGSAANAGSSETQVSDDGTGAGPAGDKITVPNEVGKNHQAAQDDLQAHGLYNLSEEDATGQGRMLILDRNWHVVSQDPAPGTKVDEDATITLRSKKYTD